MNPSLQICILKLLSSFCRKMWWTAPIKCGGRKLDHRSLCPAMPVRIYRENCRCCPVYKVPYGFLSACKCWLWKL